MGDFETVLTLCLDGEWTIAGTQPRTDPSSFSVVFFAVRQDDESLRDSEEVPVAFRTPMSSGVQLTLE